MRNGTTIVGLAAAVLVFVEAESVIRGRPKPAANVAVAAAALPFAPIQIRHVAIKVSGMFCESCEATVRTMLSRTAGVISTKVEVARGLATVSYDPAATNPAKLAEVINSLGYKATVPPGEAAGRAGGA